ncbi:ATP synthase subunit I [Azospirillum sp. B4]|uniref:ATP synthase subunit I n=1 Tax=Azospirillum sp. B4 TaxID=95605 RepID=UPI0003493356|nr:ATP synthase subunit I [Azospirillum sp. B4]
MPTFDTLPPTLAGLGLALHLALGLGLGLAYFRSLRWSLERLLPQGRAAAALLAGVLRFALLGAALTVISQEGALPLLSTALGLMAARSLATRRMRRAAP